MKIILFKSLLCLVIIVCCCMDIYSISPKRDSLYQLKHRYNFTIGYNPFRHTIELFGANRRPTRGFRELIFHKSLRLEGEKYLNRNNALAIELKTFQFKESYLTFKKLKKAISYTPSLGYRHYWFTKKKFAFSSKYSIFYHFQRFNFYNSDYEIYKYTGITIDNELVYKIKSNHSISLSLPNINIAKRLNTTDNLFAHGIWFDSLLFNYKISF